MLPCNVVVWEVMIEDESELAYEINLGLGIRQGLC